jgi:hypothetical protein
MPDDLLRIHFQVIYGGTLVAAPSDTPDINLETPGLGRLLDAILDAERFPGLDEFKAALDNNHLAVIQGYAPEIESLQFTGADDNSKVEFTGIIAAPLSSPLGQTWNAGAPASGEVWVITQDADNAAAAIIERALWQPPVPPRIRGTFDIDYNKVESQGVVYTRIDNLGLGIPIGGGGSRGGMG